MCLVGRQTLRYLSISVLLC